MKHRRAYFLLAVLLSASLAPADEKLEDIACRSVHLSYPAAEGVAFYNEIAIERSSDGTYFMVCGWSKGYFGLQELAHGKKLLLFSVWDPASGEDPKKVPDEKRVKMLHKDASASGLPPVPSNFASPITPWRPKRSMPGDGCIRSSSSIFAR